MILDRHLISFRQFKLWWMISKTEQNNFLICVKKITFSSRIDIDPELYNMFDWRYEYVDFAYPIMHEKLQIRIISGRQIDIAGQVINGVFDTLSYSLLITSTFILGILLWAFSRFEI